MESARTEKCQQAFGSFWAEFRTLGDRITSVAEAIESHVAATRAAQRKEWMALGRGAHTQLSELLAQLEDTAGSTANEAQKFSTLCSKDWRRQGNALRRITGHAGEAVFYLQFGDIVRQKTEHIAEALGEIAKWIDPAIPQSGFSSRAAEADRVIAIQIGQLNLIRTEVEAAQRKLAGAFRALAEETRHIHGALGHLHVDAIGSRTQSGAFAAFKTDMRQMGDLHRRGHELRLGARHSAENAIEASHELGRHVRAVKTLNADIHLQALNAIVKTAALGDEGATLTVLSMHMDSLYRESRDIVASVVGLLEGVASLTRARSAVRTSRRKSLGGSHARRIETDQTAFTECQTTLAAADELVAQQEEASNATARWWSFWPPRDRPSKIKSRN